jgi:hypothetical protein
MPCVETLSLIMSLFQDGKSYARGKGSQKLSKLENNTLTSVLLYTMGSPASRAPRSELESGDVDKERGHPTSSDCCLGLRGGIGLSRSSDSLHFDNGDLTEFVIRMTGAARVKLIDTGLRRDVADLDFSGPYHDKPLWRSGPELDNGRLCVERGLGLDEGADDTFCEDDVGMPVTCLMNCAMAR